MTKILFLYYTEPELEDFWEDGLQVALVNIDRHQDYSVVLKNLYHEGERSYTELEIHKYDFILGWGGFNSPVDQFIFKSKQLGLIKVPTGLCIGGNAFPVRQDDTYDVLFYETTWFAPQVAWHPNARRAFGINDDIFYQQPTDFNSLGRHVRDECVLYNCVSAGSLSKWKRHDLIKNKGGDRLVVGQIQRNNLQESMEIATDLLLNGVAVSDMVDAEQLALIFNVTKTVYIPANIFGGGERVLWEARSCGAKIEIEKDNLKLESLLKEPVLNAYFYASELKNGIQSCLK